MEKQILEWEPLFEHPLPGGMTPELVPFGDDGLGGTRCSARRQDDADLDGSLEPQDAAEAERQGPYRRLRRGPPDR